MKKKLYTLIIGCFIFLLLFCIISIRLFKKEPLVKTPVTHILNTVFYPKKRQPKSLSDSVKVISLNKLAYDNRLTDPQKALTFADSAMAMAMAKKINYIPGIADEDRIRKIGYFYLNNTERAINDYLGTLKYLKQIHDLFGQSKAYNNIGIFYREINDHEKALNYYKKTTQIESKTDTETLAGLYLNMGAVFLNQRRYKQSLDYYRRSSEVITRLANITAITICLMNKGYCNFKIDKLNNAEIDLIKAVKIAKKHQMHNVIVRSNLTLASIYIAKANYLKAEKTIKEGLDYSKLVQDTLMAFEFIKKSYQLEKKQKNHPKALSYLELLYKNDSLIFFKGKSQRIAFSMRYNIQQKKLQKNKLIIARQIYRETLFWWFITSSISLLLAAGAVGLVVYFLLQRKREQKQLLIQNQIVALEQKALQAMMNPHFIFNVMNSIQYFINNKKSQAANQILTGFAQLARKHLDICIKSYISLQEELEYLKLYLSLEKIRVDDKMNYRITLDKNIDTDEIFIPSMLIQPFIENAIWHGIMPKEGGGFIKLSLSCLNDELLINIIDNGIGISNSKKIKNSNHISRGMELIQERVNLLNKISKRQIHINIHQTGDYGTMVSLTIPVS